MEIIRQLYPAEARAVRALLEKLRAACNGRLAALIGTDGQIYECAGQLLDGNSMNYDALGSLAAGSLAVITELARLTATPARPAANEGLSANSSLTYETEGSVIHLISCAPGTLLLVILEPGINGSFVTAEIHTACAKLVEILRTSSAPEKTAVVAHNSGRWEAGQLKIYPNRTTAGRVSSDDTGERMQIR